MPGSRGEGLLGRFYARVFGGGRGSVFSGDRPEFDLATDIATAPPRENDDGGRPYVARNASLNRRTLRNPAAKAMSDSPMVVWSINRFAACTRRVAAISLGGAPV